MNICIFCGSSQGLGEKYVNMARSLGESLAKEGHGLVYGGASIGVMGALADGFLAENGEVIGVIPKSIMDLEVAHNGLTKLHVVEDMHQRKQMMYDNSDVFVALPGGMGTLDELCEIVTWAQLRYHEKTCLVYNFEGFYDDLLSHFRIINREGFLSNEHLALVNEVKSLEELKDFL